MREAKIVYYGVPAYQWHPSEVATPDLLREITTLARIEHFLWDPREQPVADKMKINYGALWTEDELPPLVTESRARAAKGDANCKEFWDAVDTHPIFSKARVHAFGNTQDEKDANTLINYIHEIRGMQPMVQRHYGRVDLENPEIRMVRPVSRRNGQFATLAAVAYP